MNLREKKTVQLQINHELMQTKEQISKSFSINKEQITNMDVVQSYYEELSCKQCGNIPNEVFVCPKCFNIYCTKCPNDDTNNICGCLGERFRRTLSEHVKVKIPIVDALVNKIDVHCKFQTLGCQTIVNYESRLQHEEQECDYAILHCTQTNCPAQVYKKDLKNHEENCDYREVNCEYCDAVMQFHELHGHLLTCYKRPVTCKWCYNTFIYDELYRHLHKCPKKAIQCDHCMSNLIYEQLESHIGENCQKKQRNFYQRNFYKEKSKTEKLQKITNEKELQIKELQETLKQLMELQKMQQQRHILGSNRTTTNRQKQQVIFQ